MAAIQKESAVPVRQFDGGRVLAARRAARLQRNELGRMLDVSKDSIGDWERCDSAPSPERLPAIAEALGQDLNVLFPRLGPPDLKDLRCDAGHTQAEAARALGISRLPLSNAEAGTRPLNDDYVQPLANLYRVEVEVLEEAQKRSFVTSGTPKPEARPRPPQTLGEKITSFLHRKPLSDREIADAINSAAGFPAVDAAGILALRTDSQESAEVQASLPPDSLFAGLGAAFGVQPWFFADGEEVERQILDRLEFLSLMRSEGVSVAARGASEGVSAAMLATLSEVLVRRESAPRPEEG
ncbi:helix-turn-helix transcriptional regulator [Streptomyces hygroscopicus]|uniref:helix-turn-helix transcriptional regulator n=1 Tax=Streptomyces hygroscopicus TaxID=1912 RepID=UPI001FCB72E3|nr:helix-turn-helix transcriptional regulator [Streptomyces hygroscopicus]